MLLLEFTLLLMSYNHLLITLSELFLYIKMEIHPMKPHLYNADVHNIVYLSIKREHNISTLSHDEYINMPACLQRNHIPKCVLSFSHTDMLYI